MKVNTKWDGSSAAGYEKVEMLRIYRLKSLHHSVLVKQLVKVYMEWDGSSAATYKQVEILRIYRL